MNNIQDIIDDIKDKFSFWRDSRVTFVLEQYDVILLAQNPDFPLNINE